MPPELARGLCVASPDPDLWLASTDPARRTEAIAACHRCPALGPCRDWSLNLPTSERGTIWGGLSHTAQIRLKKQREREAAARLS
jgi:hypothetical protein